MRRFVFTVTDDQVLGGMFLMCETESVTVPDDADLKEATRVCKAQLKARGKTARIMRAEELFTWAVTLRKLGDRRKRETWFVKGKDERQALRGLGYLPAVQRYAGFYGPRGNPDKRVAKVERMPWA